MEEKLESLTAILEQLKRENKRLATANEASDQAILSLSGEVSDLELENEELKRMIQNLKRGVR